jgi:IS30 family transposase
MRCYSHLSDDEREQIGLAKALGHSIGVIAQAIGRPRSTVWRELSRNRLPSGRYSPLHAAGAYQLRRRREAWIERDRALRTFVVDRLAEGWTPEQISGWVKGGNEPGLRAVGCETIYAFIYRAAQQAEPVMALSHTPSQTPAPTPIETFARYHQGSRLHPRPAQECRRQNRGWPLGG